MTRHPCPSCGLAWQIAEDDWLRRHTDAMSALRTSMLCKGCGGTVGDHLAPDQGGCPGHFVIDGVEMIPSGHRDKLRAEVERLRADANARAVEELTNLRNLIGGDANEGRSNGYNAACGNYVYLIGARIAELSKPAAKESEPVNGCDTFNVFGVTFTADPMAPRSAVQRAMEFITHAFSAVTTRADMKPEEPDWTVTLAAQAKVAYVNSAEPADELKVRLLSLVVEGLCNLGREVRRGGAK